MICSEVVDIGLLQRLSCGKKFSEHIMQMKYMSFNGHFESIVVIHKSLFCAKRTIALSFQSDPITSNHSGGMIGGISKKLDQLFPG